MAVLAEGVESIRLACSLVLLIPALGIALLGPRRTVLVPVWIVSAAIVAWLRFVGWWSLDAGGAVQALAGAALVIAAAVAWKRDRLASDLAVVVAAATLAVWSWVPCVGRELGAILNAARSEPWRQLLPTGVFLVGIFLPLVLVAAAGRAVPALAARVDRPATRFAGVAILAVVGGLVAVSLFDDLAGELARRSSY